MVVAEPGANASQTPAVTVLCVRTSVLLARPDCASEKFVSAEIAKGIVGQHESALGTAVTRRVNGGVGAGGPRARALRAA